MVIWMSKPSRSTKIDNMHGERKYAMFACKTQDLAVWTGWVKRLDMRDLLRPRAASRV